ncbi:hypothetical protein MARLIPOL_01320 [Marinobacter lipolyticus SM19]|uniref:Uncharacterized protein n=1 Tax=Marinobacter lipolyticus SM19 TaxID=1318628 RepID=R8B5Q7_9GAMM|nr:hypothetical protein [Marinobacter lipolyticus]EON93927.1 hypothetical protein MARLIPOL_01320 [Marinobacter lipolyticus SM19]
MESLKARIIVYATSIILAGALLFLNLPGASGAWILDDTGNLSGLASLSEGSLERYYAFLAGGVGSLGRPASLVTFAFQHNSWPEPYYFKVVNYLIHAANFLLVFVLLCNLMRAIASPKAGTNLGLVLFFALVIAFAWAASPIHQTTVQYVIQRMAMLAAFWMLVGINLWVYLLYFSRFRSADCRFLLAIVAVLLCTVMAVLSKENGILLPLLCMVVFWAKPPELQVSKPLRFVGINAVLSPIYLLLTVFIFDFQKYFIDAYTYRDFSFFERVYSQFRIIPMYAAKTLYPVGQDFVVLWDNFPVSRGLLAPISTVFGLALLIAMLVLSFVVRKKYPLITIGILVFLIGHSLESSVLALELYFEHRNYLPSVGLFIVLAGVVVGLPRKVLSVATVGVILFSLMFSLISYQEARIWGNPLKQAVRWYESNPASTRTQSHMASMLVSYGLYGKANDFYAQTIDEFPDSVTKPLMWLEISCLGRDVESSVPEILLYQSAQAAAYDKNAINTLSSIMEKLESGSCVEGTAKKVLRASLILLGNKNFAKASVDLNVAVAKIYYYAGEFDRASLYLADALTGTKRLDVLFAAVQVALAQDDRSYAVELYNIMESRCRNSLDTQCFELNEEIEQLRQQLNLARATDG